MNPLSPKERFLADKGASEAHSKFMSSVGFERASDLALLQVQLNLPVHGSTDVAAANHHRMEGAMRFLGTLMTLGDPITTAAKAPDTGLNFDATRVKP